MSDRYHVYRGLNEDTGIELWTDDTVPDDEILGELRKYFPIPREAKLYAYDVDMEITTGDLMTTLYTLRKAN